MGPRLRSPSELTRRLQTAAAVAVTAFGLAAALDAPLRAQSAQWTVRAGEVRVLCPLTVGGSFEAKTTTLSGVVSPGASPDDQWTGELVVDLNALDTGIDLRTRHMRDEYLETGRGPEFARAVLTGVHLDGIPPDTLGGKGGFAGRLRLHGVERPVRGQVELRRAGRLVRVRASFPVVLADFGIAKPRYLGVGVKDEVTVRVAFEAESAENTR